MRRLTVIDVFCGAGGLSAGFSEDQGFQIVGANDVSRDAVATYRANHPGVPVWQQDIATLDLEEMDKPDVLGGGPPCQAYSTLGRRQEGDPRGLLFREYCRVLATLRPQVFLFENVTGLLSMRCNADGQPRSLLDMICGSFGELGYTVTHAVLDAADYGAPQHRRRVIVVGSRLDHPFRFPQPTHGDGLEPHLTVADAIGDLPLEGGEGYASDPQIEYQACMRARSQRLTDHVPRHHREELIALMNMLPDGGSARDLDYPPEWFARIRSFHNTYSRLWWNRPSTTITRSFGSPSGCRCIHPRAPRALTIREAARLQGFPDHYVFCGSRSAKGLQIGNAVPPPLSAALAAAIAEHLRAAAGNRATPPVTSVTPLVRHRGRAAVNAARLRHVGVGQASLLPCSSLSRGGFNMDIESLNQTETLVDHTISPPPATAMPAVRLGQPDDTWTDDELDQYGDSEFVRSSALARKSNVGRFRAGHAYSIMRKRHIQDGTWCQVQEKRNLPRTKVWEAIEVWERATAMGHGEKEIGNHETWTEVMVAYKVKNERQRKQPVPADADGDAKHEGDGPVQGPAQAEQEQGDDAQAKPADAAPKVNKAEKKPEDDKAVQLLRETPGAIEISEGESVAFRKFVEIVGGLARAEVVFLELKRRAAHA